MTPRRYQLSKEAVAIVYRDQPWIFRDHLSSAASVFHDGDWLRLVDGKNEVVGYGIYDAEGAIAIRMVRRGAARPDAAWLRGILKAALGKRATLTGRTNAMRLINGENDGLPGVVVDRFADTLVVQSYTRGSDALARFAAIALANELKLPNVLLRPALRRKSDPVPPRVLRGAAPDIAKIREDEIDYVVDLAAGQKSGTYLDLRGLRRAITSGFTKISELPAAPVKEAKKPKRGPSDEVAPDGEATTRTPGPRPNVPAMHSLTGARGLNLFAYSGMLGRAAERAGAAHITQVDASDTALAFAAAHHVDDATKHAFVTADIFPWLPALPADAMFDLVIVDPPSMTSSVQQVPAVLAGYKKLYQAALPHVAPGGTLVVACCTSRVTRAQFEQTTAANLSSSLTRVANLAPEPDHPVAFPQADYLKIEVWRKP